MSAFVSQFQVILDLLNLARDIAIHRRVVGFQMVSSLSIVGHCDFPFIRFSDCMLHTPALLTSLLLLYT